jgi:site-specific recombinase XerD
MATSKSSKTGKRRGARTIHFLTQDEVRRLFAVIKSKRDKVMFLLAYRHGLRASEIGLLQRMDVDLKQGRIAIHRLKGSLSAVYPCSRILARCCLPISGPALIPHRISSSPIGGDPINRRTLWCVMGMYGEKAGLPPEKQKFHCLKHSIATHLLDAEADLAFVKHWLGHKNIQNTTIYAQLTTGRQVDNALLVGLQNLPHSFA